MVHRLEAQTSSRGGQCFVNTVPRPVKAAKANRLTWMQEELDALIHWPDSGAPLAIMVPVPIPRSLFNSESQSMLDPAHERELFAEKVAKVNVLGIKVLMFTHDAGSLAAPLQATPEPDRKR